MTISRRAFLASASAFSIMEGLASSAADKRIFAPNGGQAADFLICRRLYLDICGRIPTPEEVTEYVNSRDTRKREKLVDALLDSDDFADYYAMRYCDFLRVKSEFPINLWPNAVYVYHSRIRAFVARNEPWNAFGRALLTSQGSDFRDAEVNCFRATDRRTPEGWAEAVAQTFLGIAPDRLPPARRAELSKAFANLRIKNTREWKEEIVYLDDGPADATPEAFMAQLEGPLAKQFYATPVQRVHWWIYGTLAKRAVLDRWKAAFRNGGYRLKPLLRHMFAQAEYRQGPGKGGFPARRMDAEVLDDVLCTLTGARRDFGSIAPEPYSFLPPTRKSVLVEDGSISSAFLILFGRPARDSGLLEERNNRITAKQRLYLYNSSKLWRDLGNMVGKSDFKALSHADQIKELYMRFLSRPPVKDELFYFDQKNNINARDVAWFLLNSREFLYRI